MLYEFGLAFCSFICVLLPLPLPLPLLLKIVDTRATTTTKNASGGNWNWNAEDGFILFHNHLDFLHADERNRRYCMYRDGDIYAKQQRKTIITTIQTWKTLLDSVCFVRLSVFSSFYLILSSQQHTKHKYMDIDDNDHDDADSVKTSKTRMNIREKYALHFSGFKAEWKAAVSNNKKRKCCV